MNPLEANVLTETADVPVAGDRRPLRILHVVEAFSTGVFETVRQIANAHALAGHEVHIAHARRPWTADDFAALFSDEVTFHRLAWDVKREPRLLGRGTRELARLMRRGRFDLIHLHSTLAGVAGAVVKPRGVPTVYTPHGYVFLMRSLPRPLAVAARLVERIVAHRVSMIGAVSAAEAQEARGIGARRVAVIHNGLQELDDLDESANGALDDSDMRQGVVAAGRMSSQRQPMVVAEIFRACPEGTPTSWIGDTADHAASEVFQALGTRLTGWVSRNEVLELTRQARVYLHWTAWDGHPLSVLEAISVGTVVVAHDIPPVREILGERSVCREPEDAIRLIHRLLADDELYASLQREQAQAATSFSGRAMTAKWASLYAELALTP
jgi:glycosyltransferase involved in cell wall biosynthesis